MKIPNRFNPTSQYIQVTKDLKSFTLNTFFAGVSIFYYGLCYLLPVVIAILLVKHG